jgi:uncharacterized protein (TIGR02594 family)
MLQNDSTNKTDKKIHAACNGCRSKLCEDLYWKEIIVSPDFFAVPFDCPLRTDAVFFEEVPKKITEELLIKIDGIVGIKYNVETKDKKEDNPTKVPWCASFVSWCLDQTPYTSPKDGSSQCYIADDPKWNAKSKDLLRKVSDLVYGAIAVFSDCDSAGNCNSKGHVGFLYGKLPNGMMAILGGNQGNRLKLSGYDCSGKVFLSYTDKEEKKHYKIFRGFYLPKLYDYSDFDKLSEADIIYSLSEENKKLTGTEIKSDNKGESTR